MPTFSIPISSRILDPDPNGPIRTISRAAVQVEVLATAGSYSRVRATIVDTGSSYTMMSLDQAKFLGVEVPVASSRTPLRTADGSGHAIVHDGEIRLRFLDSPGRTFRLYCVFVQGMPENAPLLLGLSDFFDTFRVTFDGRSTQDAPAGHMRFEVV